MWTTILREGSHAYENAKKQRRRIHFCARISAVHYRAAKGAAGEIGRGEAPPEGASLEALPEMRQNLSTEKCGAVEIDVCPSCKGLWLDVGALGTIVKSADQGSFFYACLRILRGR